MEDGVIQEVNCRDDLVCDNTYYIIPGFIDLHYHGCYGANTMDEDDRALRHMTANILKEGTTSFLPTTTSLSTEEICRMLTHLCEYMGKQRDDEAEMLGIHLEGPFLSPLRAGAQQTEYLSTASLEVFQKFEKASKNTIKRVTLAPEMDEYLQLITYLHEKGIVASLGHSDCDEQLASRAFEKGASLVTHLFNGMREMKHREPNLACAALLHDDVYCELTADGYHVSFDMIQLAWKLKGSDKLILITDSNMAKGLPPGMYDFNGRQVYVDNEGIARLAKNDSLAGSTAKLNECLKNVVQKVGIPLEEAIPMVSENPARCIGVDHYKGFIKPGYDADLSVLDKNFQVVAIYKKGKEVSF